MSWMKRNKIKMKSNRIGVDLPIRSQKSERQIQTHKTIRETTIEQQLIGNTKSK